MKFNDWLLEKLKEQDWSQADLARASGLTRAAISRYINDYARKPDEDALRKIAKALSMAPEAVFRAAGILPPVSEIDAMIEEIIETTRHMSREEQREVLNYIRFRRAELEKKNEQTTAPRGNLASNPAK